MDASDASHSGWFVPGSLLHCFATTVTLPSFPGFHNVLSIEKYFPSSKQFTVMTGNKIK